MLAAPLRGEQFNWDTAQERVGLKSKPPNRLLLPKSSSPDPTKLKNMETRREGKGRGMRRVEKDFRGRP